MDHPDLTKAIIREELIDHFDWEFYFISREANRLVEKFGMVQKFGHVGKYKNERRGLVLTVTEGCDTLEPE